MCVVVYNLAAAKAFIPLELVYEKLQRTISFVLRFRFDSFLQRWKALGKLHNLAYFNFYHIAWFVCVLNAFNCTIQNSSFDVLCARLNSGFLTFRIN